MNILFIGPYRQNDGWGAAARDYIRALGTQTKNISIRPVYLTSNIIDTLDNELLEYENSYYQNYDIVFQKTLPHCLVPQNITKRNIGLFTLETNNISHSNSIPLLNRMTEIYVPSSQEKQSLTNSGVKVPVRVISQPIDTNIIRQTLANTNQKFPFESLVSRSFKFYTIGEYIHRKNLLDLVLAFNLAFDVTDNVSLIIKTSKPGYSHNQAYDMIVKDINNLKTQMNIGTIKNKEIVITQRLTDDQLMMLHKTCDCFVSTSMGEAFCRPAAEALCFGKTPVVTDHTGMTDFINDKNGFLIHSHKAPVVTHERTLSNDFDIYNAHEYWYKPNIYSLVEIMKKIYTMHKKRTDDLDKKIQLGLSSIDQFTHNNIGQKLCI